MKVAKARSGWRGSWLLCGLVTLLGLLAPEASAQTCPIVIDGIGFGIVNTYYPGLGTVAAGATSLRVNTNAFRGYDQDIAVGDLLLIIQMQDADIDSTNDDSYGDGVVGGAARGQTAVNSTGLYEYVVAQTAAATGSGTNVLINIIGGGAGNGTINSYRTANRTTTTGQRSYQVIEVPRGRNFTVTGITGDGLERAHRRGRGVRFRRDDHPQRQFGGRHGPRIPRRRRATAHRTERFDGH